MKRSRTQAAENGRVATAPIDDSPIPGALLTLRLLAAGQSDAGITWHERTPAGSLAFDLIGASGGVLVETRGNLLLVRFAGVHQACLTARRLQWAMQGLADNSTAGVALTALVQTGDDTTPNHQDAALSDLERAPAGKILLAQRAGQILEQEPGFATRKSGQGMLELVWRAPEEQTTRGADEMSLTRLLGETPAASVPAPAQQEQQLQSEETRVIPARTLEVDSSEEDGPPSSGGKLRWALGIAAAVALAVGGFYLFNQGPKQTKAQAGPGSGTPSVTQPASTAATTAAPHPSSPAQASAQTVKQDHPDTSGGSNQKLSRREKAKLAAAQAQQAYNALPDNPKPQPAAQPDAAKILPSGDCQYQPDQIPGLLARAENSRARGQYEDAKRKFTAVLACDRGNGKAQAGLQQVMQAMKAEGSDEH